ncbi:hypothetical protein BGM19_37990 [Streptomyces agglomeratus]|uniref:hypothetical protein n=1 Tax=Streptomyces agglomeratus TaxID=285458 RepID=UPI0008547E87|nr:hypothetical protein [Streptomyces agglomeratus]OEJ36741.1 hypothetical protein BGK72_37045 [Streptomyces agglomeratus]OEJ56466.1 hypothetical protein BGM19_37990 [Streptomyces agglomeratus]
MTKKPVKTNVIGDKSYSSRVIRKQTQRPFLSERPPAPSHRVFGTPERAQQTLDSRISYLQQQPIPAHRRTTADPEAEPLGQVRDHLQRLTDPEPQLNADRIRACLEQAMPHHRRTYEPCLSRARPGTRPRSVGEPTGQVQLGPAALSAPMPHSRRFWVGEQGRRPISGDGAAGYAGDSAG